MPDAAPTLTPEARVLALTTAAGDVVRLVGGGFDTCVRVLSVRAPEALVVDYVGLEVLVEGAFLCDSGRKGAPCFAVTSMEPWKPRPPRARTGARS